MPKHYEYTVSGTFPFPVDMLRYDACYPDRTEDALTIVMDRETYYAKRKETGSPVILEVRIRSSFPPTKERWNSFGWKVDNLRQY